MSTIVNKEIMGLKLWHILAILTISILLVTMFNLMTREKETIEIREPIITEPAIEEEMEIATGQQQLIIMQMTIKEICSIALLFFIISGISIVIIEILKAPFKY